MRRCGPLGLETIVYVIGFPNLNGAVERCKGPGATSSKKPILFDLRQSARPRSTERAEEP